MQEETQRSLSGWSEVFLCSLDPGCSALLSLLWVENFGWSIFFFDPWQNSLQLQKAQKPWLIGSWDVDTPSSLLFPPSILYRPCPKRPAHRDPALTQYSQPVQCSPCFREGMRHCVSQCSLPSLAAKRGCWVPEPSGCPALPGAALCCASH